MNEKLKKTAVRLLPYLFVALEAVCFADNIRKVGLKITLWERLPFNAYIFC